MVSRRQRVTNAMHLCVMSHGVRILSIIAVSREFSWFFDHNEVQKLTFIFPYSYLSEILL